MSQAELAPVQEITNTQTQHEKIHQDSSKEVPYGSNPQLPVDCNFEPPENVNPQILEFSKSCSVVGSNSGLLEIANSEAPNDSNLQIPDNTNCIVLDKESKTKTQEKNISITPTEGFYSQEPKDTNSKIPEDPKIETTVTTSTKKCKNTSKQ